MSSMPFALTIAGFDGSGGAGILADIKVFEAFGVYGQAVCTAMTVQNERSFSAPGWVPWEQIQAQLEKLQEIRSFHFIKIGLVENADVLAKIVAWVRKNNPEAYLIWDPIMSASAGYRFFKEDNADAFFPIFAQMNLITPNQFEFAYLGLGVADSRDEVAIGTQVSILLKGGHAQGDTATDVLWTHGERLKYTSPRISGEGKHGTGCTLSSAILANLALGKTLPEACQIAKEYMDHFLKGGEGLLGRVH